jgi:hypothetical protein
MSPPANLRDLPVMEAAGGGGVHVNATKALKQLTSPPDRTPVGTTKYKAVYTVQYLCIVKLN